jgi:uncharacterized membrane protein YhhN
MTPLRWLPLGTGALALAVLLWAEVRGRPRIRAVAKTLTSLCFVAVAFTGGRLGTYGALVVTGLVLSVAGDVLLLSREKGPFLAGLVSFLLAHVAYVVAFAPLSSRPLVALLGVGLTVAVVLRWLWPHLGPMRIPVVAYCAVIGAMAWLAIGVPSPLVRTGAILFFLSDLFVARGRFVHPGKENQLLGWPLYYAGQFLIALSVG